MRISLFWELYVEVKLIHIIYSLEKIHITYFSKFNLGGFCLKFHIMYLEVKIIY
jgi:hypothetical protein